MRRADIDADQVHAERMQRAQHDLQQWGRWVMQRADGGVGYGQSALANLQRAGRSAEHYQAPIIETHCSWVDDAVCSLGPVLRDMAKLHYGRGYSYRYIAREGRIAPATVSRSLELVQRTVAYWGRRQPVDRTEA
jgi:hypothetical protein